MNHIRYKWRPSFVSYFQKLVLVLVGIFALNFWFFSCSCRSHKELRMQFHPMFKKEKSIVDEITTGQSNDSKNRQPLCHKFNLNNRWACYFLSLQGWPIHYFLASGVNFHREGLQFWFLAPESEQDGFTLRLNIYWLLWINFNLPNSL